MKLENPTLPIKAKPNINEVKDLMKLLPHDLWIDRLFHFFQIEKYQHSFFEYADLLPFDSDATEFSFTNAWYLSEASYLAYAREKIIVAEMAKIGHKAEYLQSGNKDGEGFISYDDDNVFLVFRGTEAVGFRDYVTNIRLGIRKFWRYRNKPFIHDGFNALFRKMAHDNQIFDQLAQLAYKGDKKRKVWFAGHSLGGALTGVAAYYAQLFSVLDPLDIRTYTYGCPRVGNKHYADSINFPSYRIIHDNDLISRVPPKGIFRHCGDLIFIEGGGEEIAFDLIDVPNIQIHWMKKNLGHEDTKFASILEGLDSWYLSRMDEMLDPFLDHAPVYYSTYLWNYIANHPEVIR